MTEILLNTGTVTARSANKDKVAWAGNATTGAAKVELSAALTATIEGVSTLVEQQTQTTKLTAIQAAVEAVGIDRYPSTQFYKAKINFTGATAGDTIERTRVYDTGSNTIISTVWTNETLGTTLASAPTIDVQIEYIGGDAITATEYAVTIGKMSIDQTTPGTTNLVDLKVKAEAFAPTYAEGSYNELSQNLGGYLRVLAVGGSADNVDANAASSSGHLPTVSHKYSFNGTTWDRDRSGVSVATATLTGLQNSLSMGRFNTTPATRTDGQVSILETDSAGNLLTSEKIIPLTSDTPSSVASSATSVTLIAANANRRSLTIFNNSTAILYVCFGATATQAGAKAPIGAGGFYEMPTGQLYTGVVSGIWASANGNASIYEGV